MSQGIIYVATGERCRKEAQFSLMTLLRTNPDMAVTLFTDGAQFFEETILEKISVVIIENPTFSFMDKLVGFRNTPYDKTLFLDADTVITSDLSHLFELLERYDFCSIQDQSSPTNHHVENYTFTAPETVPEFNSGVVLYRKTPEVETVLAEWEDLYRQYPGFRTDQDPLREVLYHSDLRTHILPKTYNFMPGLSTIIEGPVYIFHSPRALDNPSSFISFMNWINSTNDLRMFVPPETLFRIS